jgi:hypothetical protein
MTVLFTSFLIQIFCHESDSDSFINNKKSKKLVETRKKGSQKIGQQLLNHPAAEYSYVPSFLLNSTLLFLFRKEDHTIIPPAITNNNGHQLLI